MDAVPESCLVRYIICGIGEGRGPLPPPESITFSLLPAHPQAIMVLPLLPFFKVVVGIRTTTVALVLQADSILTENVNINGNKIENNELMTDDDMGVIRVARSTRHTSNLKGRLGTESFMFTIIPTLAPSTTRHFSYLPFFQERQKWGEDDRVQD